MPHVTTSVEHFQGQQINADIDHILDDWRGNYALPHLCKYKRQQLLMFRGCLTKWVLIRTYVLHVRLHNEHLSLIKI